MRRSAARFFTIFLALLVAQISLAGAQDGTRGLLSLPLAEKGGPRNVQLYSHSFALVIGIDKYDDPSWPSLSNAINDAVAIKRELEKRGFDVQYETNLQSTQLKKVIEDFIYEKGRHKQARLFIWYAGHGHTIDGEGYLVPSDAPSADKEDWRFRRKSLSLREFSRFMREARAKHVMTVFDSCFSGTVFAAARSKPPSVITRAITQKVRQFVSSGEAKQTVSDNGLFRKLFLDAITGKDARADMNGDGYIIGSELGLYLHQRVTNLTNNRQTPRSGKLNAYGYDLGDFVFRVGKEAPAPLAKTTGPGEGGVMAAMRKRLAALEDQLKKRIPNSALSDIEKPATKRKKLVPGWKYPAPKPDSAEPPAPSKNEVMIKEVQVLLAQQGYKPGLADGKYGLDTRDAITAFQRDMGTHSRGIGFGKVDQRLLTALKMASRTRKVDARRKAREKREGEKRVAVGVFPKPLVAPRRLPYEPEVVLIPGGTFSMGCVSGKDCNHDEKPVHKVTLRPFYLGKYEITFGQFKAFVDASGHKPSSNCDFWSDGGWANRNDRSYVKPGFAVHIDKPAVCVSWDDAVVFGKWLTRKTGKTWRLPTEAEWEYAARGERDGNSRTKFSWGNSITCRKASYDGDKASDCYYLLNNKYRGPLKVGSFSANKFGLFDMHGNVWEWVHDWHKKYKKGSQSNPLGPRSGERRAIRGGSWLASGKSARSANRIHEIQDFRDFNLGFRLVREP